MQNKVTRVDSDFVYQLNDFWGNPAPFSGTMYFVFFYIFLQKSSENGT